MGERAAVLEDVHQTKVPLHSKIPTLPYGLWQAGDAGRYIDLHTLGTVSCHDTGSWMADEER